MSRDDEPTPGDDGLDPDDVDPDSVPTVIDRALVEPIQPTPQLRAPERADPFDRARTALRAARLARGEDPDAPEPEPEVRPVDRGDPFSRAESALQRAAAARAEAAHGRAALERENRAREELQRLKGGDGRPVRSADSKPARGDSADETPPKPRKRRL